MRLWLHVTRNFRLDFASDLCDVIVICDDWLLLRTWVVKCGFEPGLVAIVFRGVKCGSK